MQLMNEEESPSNQKRQFKSFYSHRYHLQKKAPFMQGAFQVIIMITIGLFLLLFLISAFSFSQDILKHVNYPVYQALLFFLHLHVLA